MNEGKTVIASAADFWRVFDESARLYNAMVQPRIAVLEAQEKLMNAEQRANRPETAIERKIGLGYLLRDTSAFKARLETAQSALRQAESAFMSSFGALLLMDRPHSITAP